MRIAFCGLIGSGKTTLTKNLSKIMKLPAYYEEVEDNPYLEPFYKKLDIGYKLEKEERIKRMEGIPLLLQFYLLNYRYQQQQKINWENKGCVQDRSIYEDMIFAKLLADDGFIDNIGLKLFEDMTNTLMRSMQNPDLLVYLDVSPEIAIKRINTRNRGIETGITIDYLKKLQIGYEKFIKDISKRIPVIRVDWSEFIDEKIVAKKIYECYQNINNTTNITFN